MPIATTDAYGDLRLIPRAAETPLRERLEWVTEVNTSRNGTEERLSQRGTPRQSFTMKVPLQPADTAFVFNVVYGKLGALWGIPVWSEAQRIDPVTLGDTSIPCDAEFRDFRDASLGLLWSPGGAYEVLSITTVSPTALAVEAVAASMSAAWVLPFRVGRLLSAQRSTGGSGADWDLSFEVEDNIDLEPAAPAQYLGNDIYFDEVLIPSGERMDTNIIANVERVDDGLGVVSTFNLWDDNRTRQSQGVVLTTPEEVWAYRQFLHRRKGRFRAFWQPSFLNDLRLASGSSITTTLVVMPDDREDNDENRDHIAIQVASGTWYARAITAEAMVGDNLELTLDSTLGGLDPATIVRICYLGLKRLDADRIELSWPGNGVCVSSYPVLELTP